MQQDKSESQGVARAAIHGTMWMYASHYSGKAIVFLSTLVLARLLSQEDYGVAGYALVFIALLEVVGDLGIGAALIYYRDDEEALNTGFWLALGTGITLFAIAWLAAPLVGDFYRDDRAVAVTRMLAVVFPLSALGNIHNMLLYRRLDFGRRFIPGLVMSLGKAGTAVAMGALGFGAWSLIFGQIVGVTCSVVAYWSVVPWRPSFEFHPSRVGQLMTYGLKLISVNILSVLDSNVDYLFVGRFLGAASLGVYTLAFRIPELMISQVCSVIAHVAFPVYARLKDDRDLLRHGFLTTTRYLTMVTVPIGIGLALVAKPAVLVLFGEKWIEAVPVLPAIAMYSVIVSLLYNAGDVYKAIGRPELLIYLSLVELAILLPAMWWAVTVPANIVAVGWVHVAVATVGRFIDLGIASWLLDLPVLRIMEAWRPALVSGVIMAAAVWLTLLSVTAMPAVVQLVLGVLVGVLVYSVALYLTEWEVVLAARRVLRISLARR